MKNKLQVISEMAALTAMKKIKAGESIGWHPDFATGKVTIAEMIGTDDGSREFIEKVTYDAYQGRENVPLLYKPLFSTKSDPNFPQTMTAKEFGPVEVVFFEFNEGGEVVFGSLGPESEKVVSITTYAAGLEYSEDMEVYNQTWRISDIGAAFGEAFNHLLNHIHLSPIISASYTTTGGGLSGQRTAQYEGTAQLIAWSTDLKTTLTNAIQVLPRGTKFLINSFDRFAMEAALAAAMYQDNSPTALKSKFNPADAFIEYDGATLTLGKRTYTYTGVTQGYAYLVAPKRQFVEYVKHDLLIDGGVGDRSRLILNEMVGRARRGALVAVGGEYGAVKIDIAA